MKVNELVKSSGYTKDILSHFIITLFDNDTDYFICIKEPTLDEYVHLCDRKVLEWYPDDFHDDSKYIDIYVKMQEKDCVTFKSHRSL